MFWALYGDSSVNKLPKHYREALMLYADIADSASVVPYEIDDAAMRSSLDALRAVEARYSDLFVRGNYVRKEFGRTYWWTLPLQRVPNASVVWMSAQSEQFYPWRYSFQSPPGITFAIGGKVCMM